MKEAHTQQKSKVQAKMTGSSTGDNTVPQKQRQPHNLAVTNAKKGDTIPQRRGFHILPKRWIVERTFAWFSLCRRLNRDYELLTTTTEAWLWLRAARLSLRKITT